MSDMNSVRIFYVLIVFNKDLNLVRSNLGIIKLEIDQKIIRLFEMCFEIVLLFWDFKVPFHWWMHFFREASVLSSFNTFE